jgi:dTDP-4-dehydrorhamnose 3,5-epimerase-like enzyme
MIDGVRLVELIRHIDDQVLAVRNHPRHRRVPPKFGENNVVCSAARGTIRGFHEHHVRWDYFCVVRGAAKSVSADAAEEVVEVAADKGEPWVTAALETYVLSERKPSLLVVPAGI